MEKFLSTKIQVDLPIEFSVKLDHKLLRLKLGGKKISKAHEIVRLAEIGFGKEEEVLNK
jgi:hypothetical protein